MKRRPPLVLDRDRARGVATLVLARGVGNLLDEPMLAALRDAALEIRHDDAVRAVVVAADGRDFCLGGPTTGEGAPLADEAMAAVGAIEAPVVAAVHGRVEALGLALALAADVLVAEPGVRLAATAPAAGYLPGGGLVPRLVRAVGPARATEMLLLGTRLGLAQALRWGLVQRRAAAGRARNAARTIARDLARRAPIALRYAKEACRRALDLPLDQGMRLEHDLYVLLQTTADRREGIAAFREHRPPRFAGR